MKFLLDTDNSRTRLKEPVRRFLDKEYLNAKETLFDTGNVLLDSALHLASLDCPVFPVHSTTTGKHGNRICTCRRWEACENQGKHPRTRHGFIDSTVDETTIRKWWKQHPNSNVGLLTGRDAGFFVLDIDVKYGGEFSLDELRESYQNALGEYDSELPESLTAYTGSGGRHIFFKYPVDIFVSGSVAAIGAGLDIRADSNYVVVAPSNHLSGGTYRWHGVNTPILDAPDWLIHEIILSDEKESPIPVERRENVRTTTRINDGEGRYDYLWRYICGLVNSFPKEEVLSRALEMNSKVLDPPKPKPIVEYQVDYAFKKYGRKELA